MTTTNLNTGGRPKSTGTDKDKSSGTKTSKAPKHTMFNEQDPAGSVVMITPAVTAGLQLYRIDDHVTFGWNYTNLQGTPTAIDVLASALVKPNFVSEKGLNDALIEAFGGFPDTVRILLAL